MARPSSFKPEYCEQATKLCKLGATDRELAEFFDIAESTLNLWKLQFPEFSESLKRGKTESDSRVEQSLYRRALGYSHDAVQINVTKDGGVIQTPYVKHYPPETVACIFWLKNRQPEAWRDKFDFESDISRERAAELLRLVQRRLEAIGESSPAPDQDDRQLRKPN